MIIIKPPFIKIFMSDTVIYVPIVTCTFKSNVESEQKKKTVGLVWRTRQIFKGEAEKQKELKKFLN